VSVHSLQLPVAGRESLVDVLGFVDSVFDRDGIDADAAFAIRLAIEEACTNIITHGYRDSGPGPIRLRIETDGARILISIEDNASTFNPETKSAPEMEADWNDREIGGLGIHLIRQMMDEVVWEPLPDGGNRLRLVKRRNSNHP
jgi:serine/threonine-protein kinase RsbW